MSSHKRCWDKSQGSYGEQPTKKLQRDAINAPFGPSSSRSQVPIPWTLDPVYSSSLETPQVSDLGLSVAASPVLVTDDLGTRYPPCTVLTSQISKPQTFPPPTSSLPAIPVRDRETTSASLIIVPVADHVFHAGPASVSVVCDVGARSPSPTEGESLVVSPAPLVPAPASPVSTSHSQAATEDAFGLKELAHGIAPVIDIIAVHGLDGHRENTWTAKNGALWLRDSLPKAINNARITTYGYDARTHGSTLSSQSIHDHALEFISCLSTYRRKTKTEKRPIIFIAHCVGGNIVKEALIHSNSANKNNLQYHNAIKTSTTGVLFFGTPHQGANNICWSEIVNNASLSKRNDLIFRDIEECSQSIQKQLTQYNHISQDFETKFFYETYALAPGKDPVVPHASAVVPGAANVETFSINSDHVNMVKYRSANDGNFQKVSDCISLMVDNAPKMASDNWKRHEMIVAAENNGGFRITFSIPFELECLRNSRFTGRESLLDTLHREVKTDNTSGFSRPIVLYGTGGIGKTQIVTEYIYAHREEYSSIFWINAATRETIFLSFRTAAQRVTKEHARITLNTQPDYALIAKNLGMVGLVDELGSLSVDEGDNERIVDAMKLWFSKGENKDWLLIFDNADDLETFIIGEFIPSVSHGTIIMTSRRPGCGSLGKGLEVTEMLQQDGVDFLLRNAGMETERNGVHLLTGYEDNPTSFELAKKLGYMPLALAQAGAYVAAQGISFEVYLQIYNKHFKTVAGKLPPAAVWPYGPRSVLTTWEISFKAIQESNEAATELLSLCSLLSNEIKMDMLWRGMKLEENDTAIGESLSLLFSYSLAQPQKTSGSFYIHPVVHQWARERLGSDERYRKTQTAFILVGRAISYPGLKTLDHWKYENRIMSHIHTITTNIQICLPEVEVGSALFVAMERIAKVNNDWGRLKEAITLGNRVVDVARRSLGDDNLKTLVANLCLATMYAKNGQIHKAAEMDLEVVQRLRRTLGEEHPNTLSAINNLANTYSEQGRHGEAGTMQELVLEARRRTLGEEHPNTLTAINNLANTYSKQGRHGEAGTMQELVLEARRRTLGEEHPDTLTAISNLANTYSVQGRQILRGP